MKNIVIVTWLGTGNYGTSLQSFALHEFLKKKGYQVSILHPFNENKLSFLHRLIEYMRCMKMRLKCIVNQKLSRISSFNKENYNHTIVSSRKQYEKLLSSTDVFVTGSDQIWNCYNSFDPVMFLNFAGDVKRIAYASSMGTKDFPSQYKQKIHEWLSKFQHIGVREQTMTTYLSSFLNRSDVVQVLDPTFLLDSTEWVSFGKKSNMPIQEKEPYIFCYLIGNRKEYKQQLLQIKELSGIQPIIIIPSLEGGGLSINNSIIHKNADPYEFIELLYNASLIVTDSFHACALSINLSKDFIVFKRFSDNEQTSQNSRLYDLLSHYHLEDRWYQEGASYKSIKYQDIQKRLNADRKVSIDFLINSIEH